MCSLLELYRLDDPMMGTMSVSAPVYLVGSQEFRRMVYVRILTQGADALVQVAMASYVLLNPQNQPNAWAIAGVIALLIMPFSLIGPFISPLVDRFQRRQIVIICDVVRLIWCAGLAYLIASGHIDSWWTPVLYMAALIVLSANRLQLAALSAGIAHLVHRHIYLDAMAVMPLIGPVAAVLFGGGGGVLRLYLAGHMAHYRADGILFAIATASFLIAVAITFTFRPRAFGPDSKRDLRRYWNTVEVCDNPRQGSLDADSYVEIDGKINSHILTSKDGSKPTDTEKESPLRFGASLIESWTAVLSYKLPMIAFFLLSMVKIAFGITTVTIIVFYRSQMDIVGQAAIASMGLWFVISGIGFALSGVSTPLLSRSLGMRKTIIVLIAGAALSQSLIALSEDDVILRLAAFLIGWMAQSIKVCTDTIVQAHVDDNVRGQTMVLYDIVNNASLVIGAVIAAAVIPADGHSPAAMGIISAAFIALAVIFAVGSSRDDAAYDEGTSRSIHRSVAL